MRKSIKRTLSAVVAATFISVMPAAASAEEIDVGLSGGFIDDTDGKFYSIEADGAVSAEWDGSIATEYAGGAGKASNPYLIANGQQLAYLAQQVDAGTDYSGVFFKLTADILLNDDVDDEPNEWNAIGKQTTINGKNAWFQGTFDGANHKIIGIYQNEENPWGGLFSWVGDNGTVKNVGVTDGIISCRGLNVGGICGNNCGTISNCYNTIRIIISI